MLPNKSTQNLSPLQVLLFIPNIIDYLRVLLMFTGFYFMQKNWKIFITLYSAATFLDALDGYFSRKFNQASKVGSVLDLLIDMMATMCLSICLCSENFYLFFLVGIGSKYIKFWIIFQVFIFLANNCNRNTNEYVTKNLSVSK